ncbi:Pilin/Flagellin, FlaG/FlaF family [Halorhabdus sp. SVX81]|uniref:type IV pilin N-terminal domain-containing protein n=1 Tax=Halorhabdus sp. SVX81 TaxID=2978283 RepID=UPI0023DB96B7|nr:type IV pilin N-terminal domain-containing protein [Halorhabdus sp. SVX81]WEL16748.1 Pilin/Flagellin, FlaG/FlaF family [Halorhabdus sp. SVX81]
MDLKSLLDDDTGVSPVIGVILMVAITVILAAVIATFVMNMGPNEETAPTASWDVTNESSHILIDHTGGGGAEASKLSVVVSYDGLSSPSQETFELTGSNGFGSDVTLNASSSFRIYNTSDAWNSGLSGTITPYAEMDSAGSSADYKTANVASVELIWEAENSDTSEVLTTWEP